MNICALFLVAVIQVTGSNSLGGYFYSLNLSDELRTAVQPEIKFRQFCAVKDATQQGMKKGDTFTWDVVSDIATRGTTLVETNTMPESNFTIIQGTLTITEAGNSVPYSGKLENLSKFTVREPVMKALKNDTVKTLDVLAHAQFNLTPLVVVGTSTAAVVLTTNGTALATNSVAFNNSHHKAIVDIMKERNIPAYVGDDYIAIAWPSTLRTFKNNLENIHQYTETGLKLIFNGEIGRYENTRFIEQTLIPKGGAQDTATWNAYTNTADPWDNGLSDWIFFTGDDNVAEAINTPEEMRAKIPTDYGRSKGVAWYYLGGFGIVHGAADVLNARIVKWSSAS